MIQLENPSLVYEMTDEALYNVFLTVTDLDAKIKQKVKHGINMNFPIWYIHQEWYSTNPSTGRVTIQGHGKWKLQDFLEELEQRRLLMLKTIEEEINTPGTTIPRT